jgi:hypothetical protein
MPIEFFDAEGADKRVLLLVNVHVIHLIEFAPAEAATRGGSKLLNLFLVSLTNFGLVCLRCLLRNLYGDPARRNPGINLLRPSLSFIS